jgi:3-deoxy-D-arabino-heptulosonate 7-phosphate (DAHP) synthase
MAFSCAAGLVVIAEMMEAERTAIVARRAAMTRVGWRNANGSTVGR